MIVLMTRFSVIFLLLLYLHMSVSTDDLVNKMLGKLKKTAKYNEEQINNAREILRSCVQLTTSIDQLAYVLSTAIGESHLKPQKEKRVPKEKPEQRKDQDTYWIFRYYGRGFVMLRKDENYKRFTQAINEDILSFPEKALEPATAAKIICIGMFKGMFTGKRLNDYFNSTSADWVNARSIINLDLNKAKNYAVIAKRISKA